jgi:hypothetical protein
MKKESIIYCCDVCEKEIAFKDIKEVRLPVIVKCDQSDGSYCQPFLDFKFLDLCNACLHKVAVVEYGFREVIGIRKNA